MKSTTISRRNLVKGAAMGAAAMGAMGAAFVGD